MPVGGLAWFAGRAISIEGSKCLIANWTVDWVDGWRDHVEQGFDLVVAQGELPICPDDGSVSTELSRVHLWQSQTEGKKTKRTMKLVLGAGRP